ncbi:hypothetical protein JIN85_06185 [Luteolibacter pohnpeiensis]|uniref:SLA1 homology domain-containing protein n=1 Tax=Luteolibacter pohnpeiensis TaxID=454153 RepID=A0A934S2I7_9BACT|nr:SHD1 domain-containing protein [Luteolibacter pohnpeiensis]MBK1881995.1 hypothetical protein [Luteolibacter pohnpeiensis]
MRPIILLLLSCSLVLAAEPRTWTDSQDRKVEATLVRLDGSNVILKLANGREVPYPLEKLSAEDQKYVQNLHIEQPENGEAADTSDGKEVVTTEPVNFDSPWPERVNFKEDPEIQVVEEDADAKRFVYESQNYQYVCDVRLSQSVVKGFAVMFEATNLYCTMLPIGLNGGHPTTGKNKILLFEHKKDYVKAGAPPSSAGVFMPRLGLVMVPLESLGVKPVGSSYMLDRSKDNSTLCHELTHQLTPEPYDAPGSLGWFTEGLAEYVANTPYRNGSFDVRFNLKSIIQTATAYGSDDVSGRALGEDITLPDMKTYMMQTYPEFLSTPQLSYGTGMLMATYFFQMDGDGDAKRIKAFLKALRSGKEGEDALAVLLDGRTYKQLEDDITRAWSKKGIKFTFKPAPETD